MEAERLPYEIAAEHAENFARLLVEYVRDPAVASMLAIAAGEIRGPVGDAWSTADDDERLKMAIAHSVDETIFRLLDAIDNGVLDLRWVVGDGELVELAGSGLGELGGEYVVEDGWRDRFSKELCFPGY